MTNSVTWMRPSIDINAYVCLMCDGSENPCTLCETYVEIKADIKAAQRLEVRMAEVFKPLKYGKCKVR